MPSPTHIAVLSSTYPRYDGDPFPPFVHDLCRHLIPGQAVTVITPYCAGSEQKETRDGVDVIRYRYWFSEKNLLSDGGAKLPKIRRNPLNLFQVPGFIFGQFFALRKLAKEKPIDSIHAHWILPQGLIAVLYKLFVDRKVRVVITSHGADIFGLKSLRGMKRWILNRADAATAVSQAIADAIQALGVKESLPVHIRSMGIDTTRFTPEAADSGFKAKHGIKGPLVFFVGRLTEKKGVRYLIDAMPEVLAKHANCFLWISGYGELDDELRSQAGNLGLGEDKLRFGGQVTHAELPGLYATANIFAGPSIVSEGGDTEGFGLVFAEAQACGSAVICTDLPAMGDIVKDGETGRVVPQKDAGALSSAIIELLDHPELRQKLAAAGCQHTREHFSWAAVAADYAGWLEPAPPS